MIRIKLVRNVQGLPIKNEVLVLLKETNSINCNSINTHRRVYFIIF